MDSPKSSSSSPTADLSGALPALPSDVPQDLKVLRVAVRMLMDFVKVMTEKTRGFEVGCKCKDAFIAEALEKVVTCAVGDLRCIVTRTNDNVVVIKDVV